MRFFLDDNVDMMLPGDHGNVYLTLLLKMVMVSGQQFTVRENNITVATGIVTETLENVNISNSLGKMVL